MIRLILLMFFIVVLVIGALAMLALMQQIAGMVRAESGNDMSKTIQNIAYAMLVVLLFGITTGWIGAV